MKKDFYLAKTIDFIFEDVKVFTYKRKIIQFFNRKNNFKF